MQSFVGMGLHDLFPCAENVIGAGGWGERALWRESTTPTSARARGETGEPADSTQPPPDAWTGYTERVECQAPDLRGRGDGRMDGTRLCRIPAHRQQVCRQPMRADAAATPQTHCKLDVAQDCPSPLTKELGWLCLVGVSSLSVAVHEISGFAPPPSSLP